MCSPAIRTIALLCLTVAKVLGVDATSQKTADPSEAERLVAHGQKLRADGRFAEALNTFRAAVQKAKSKNDLRDEAKALMLAGACQIYLFQYRPALISLNAARELSRKANDKSVEGGTALDLSTVYELLGDFSLANREAEEGVALLRNTGNKDYLIKALLNLANIQSDGGHLDRAIDSYDEAIHLARQARMEDAESLALEELGISLVLAGRLREAENALSKAKRIQTERHDENLAFTMEHLAELELAKHDYAAGLKQIDQAFGFPSRNFKTAPQYYPVHIRGKLLFGLGRKSEALKEFRRAVELADEWRAEALPGDATSIRTGSHLHEIYQDYIQLAAQTALEHHDGLLTREVWEVVAETRAWSLREQMSLYLDRAGRLPPRYFGLLSELQDAQARFTLGIDANGAKVREIRLELNSLSNEIGLPTKNLPGKEEKFFRKKSLTSIQEKLSAREVLLSYWLGGSKSFLWTVTRESVNLSTLAPETDIAHQAADFTNAVRALRNADAAGTNLSETLFGSLSAKELRRPEWLIAADGALLNGVPFAALPPVSASGSHARLASDHTLRFLPSEILLLRPTETNSGRRFVAVADPIYNLADSRRVPGAPLVQAKNVGVPLARLVGSDREIRSAAKCSGMPDVEFLVGERASLEGLNAALSTRLDVLHFAVHVVSPNGHPGEAALALSLNRSDVPELLTPEAIAAYRVLGSLVVMSGCSSQQGETVPSAGVIGLSRSWLLAGAAAVIVSGWPTPDDSGQFFSSFYCHFRKLTRPSSLASRAATALAQAQQEMQRSGGYRASPAFWAAYSVISKE